MQIRYLSLSEPETTGYLINSDMDWQPIRNQGCVEWARAFDTYSDGLAQHAPDRPIQLKELADFLASTAQYLMEQGTEEEKELVAKKWPYFSFSTAEIIFSADLRPTEEGKKTIYFCPSERKTSTNSQKVHDRRWHEVPEWADGSATAVYTLLCNFPEDREFRDTLTRYAIYDRIRDVIAGHLDRYDEHPAVWIGGGDLLALKFEPNFRLHLDQAYTTLSCLVQSITARKDAENQLASYKHNTRKREPKAATEEQAA